MILWQPNGHLLQVYVGSAVVEAATGPDQRGLLGRIAGEQKMVGQRLPELIRSLREQLRSHGIELPIVDIRDSPSLQPQGVEFWIGLEWHSFLINSLEDIPGFLAQRIVALHTNYPDYAGVQRELAAAVACVQAENYQEAWQRYCTVYYHSALQNFHADTAQSLNDVGNIYLRNGDIATAEKLLVQAHAVSHTQPVLVPSLRPQITLNLATVVRSSGNVPGALNLYQLAADEAYATKNSVLLFLTLMGAAELRYQTGEYAAAITLLDEARKLVGEIPSDQPFALRYQVERAINDVLTIEHTQPSRRAAPAQRSGLFDELKSTLVKTLAVSLVNSAVCKLFDVGGGGLSLSLFGASYDLRNSAFNGVTAVGDNVTQNIA